MSKLTRTVSIQQYLKVYCTHAATNRVEEVHFWTENPPRIIYYIITGIAAIFRTLKRFFNRKNDVQNLFTKNGFTKRGNKISHLIKEKRLFASKISIFEMIPILLV